MQTPDVTVQSLSDYEVQVDVEIDAERVDRELSKQAAKIGKKARIKGFRPGKAPKSMVKKLFSSQIASDATRSLINDTFEQALEKSGRSPVGEPQIEPSLAQQGQTLKYSIRVQVKPTIELHHWKGLEVSAAPAVVTDEEVGEEIERLRQRHKERVPVEGRGADTSDVVIVNTTGAIAGEQDERLTTQDLEVRIGSGQMIEGFEDQLMGAEVGETRELDVKFPEEYHTPDLADQPAKFQAEVVAIFTEELPELDDDFAQDVGYDTLEELRDSIRTRLETQAESERNRTIERKLISLLVERHKFDAPPSMVQAQLDASARRMLMLMQMQGMPQDQALDMVRGNFEQMKGQAEQAVKRYLVLEALAEQEGIDIDDEALNAEIVKKIEQAGERGEGLYDSDEERENLRYEMQEQAALDLLKSRAKISDAEPEPAPSDGADEEAATGDETSGDEGEGDE